jgi:uncharacterized protein
MNDVEIAKSIRSAIKTGDAGTVLKLIAANGDEVHRTTPFGTWLHVASSHGQLGIVKLLVELGSDVNAAGGILGGNALNAAASAGHIDVVEHLLEKGAVMDTSDPQKNPLFSAIYGGHVSIVKLLLASGIDKGVRYTGSSMSDMGAEAFARERGQSEIVKLLSEGR